MSRMSGILNNFAADYHAIRAQHPMKMATDAQLSAIGYRLSAMFTSALHSIRPTSSHEVLCL